jgi:hypothetical protein
MLRMSVKRGLVWAVIVGATFLVALLDARPAAAYTWMIRHGYTSCTPCHTDPSGAGPLAAYGRAQSDLLLRSRYGVESQEADPASGFLWGVLPLPDNVRLGGDVRGGLLSSKATVGPISQRFILMRSDLYGDLKFGRLRLAGSIGYASTGALDAAITRGLSENLISREYWIGAELDEDGAWLARAGRMALPFGIRTVEHTLWVRDLTRTDLLDDQQDGVAVSVSKDWIRGEIMGIAGNYQLHPDEYRERGFSGYVEVAPTTRFTVGASSLFTRATRDVVYRVTDYRQAHGLFVRYSPVTSLALLGEGDWVYQSLTWNGHRGGFALFVQGDWEPTQGFHFMLTGEAKNDGNKDEPPSFAGWVSAAWFFGRHVDFRMDDIYQRLGSKAGDTDVFSLLFQLHVFL